MRHLAWIFLVDPLVQFYQTPLSSDLPRPIQDAMSATFPQYLVPRLDSLDDCVGDFPWEGQAIRRGSEREQGGPGGSAAGCAESVRGDLPHHRGSPVLPVGERPEDGERAEANQDVG